MRMGLEVSERRLCGGFRHVFYLCFPEQTVRGHEQMKAFLGVDAGRIFAREGGESRCCVVLKLPHVCFSSSVAQLGNSCE